MTATMTITDNDWTIDVLTDQWADEEDAKVARACANAQYAWLILNTRQRLADLGMPGWSYGGISGSFSGPATNRPDIYDTILGLITESIDYVADNIGEIRADAQTTAQA